MLFRFTKQRASYNIRIEHANLNATRKTVSLTLLFLVTLFRYHMNYVYDNNIIVFFDLRLCSKI